MHILSLPLSNADVARFWSKVHKTDTCWLWTAGTFDNDYGAFWLRNHTVKAHRVSWVLAGNTLTKDDLVLHTCDTPPCVFPDHLWLGTSLDNMRDRDMKGRHGWSKRTACTKGHEYTEANVYIDSRGHRVCLTCRKNAESVVYILHTVQPFNSTIQE